MIPATPGSPPLAAGSVPAAEDWGPGRTEPQQTFRGDKKEQHRSVWYS